jgi:hypothetical protein
MQTVHSTTGAALARPALRTALLLDAAASGAMGALLAVAATPLDPFLGLPGSLLRWAGVALLPYAAFLLWLASRAGAAPGAVRAVVGGNVLWVVASLFLLVSGLVTPTRLGVLVVLAQAAAVAAFAYLEHRALRRGDAVHRSAAVASS